MLVYLRLLLSTRRNVFRSRGDLALEIMAAPPATRRALPFVTMPPAPAGRPPLLVLARAPLIALAQRLVGTLRRECLDHLIPGFGAWLPWWQALMTAMAAA